MSGRLIGVGVGPGDPELMTLKAYRLIASASIVAYPAAEGGESRARATAAAAIAPGAEEIPFHLPMRVDPSPAQAVYDATASALAERLEAGCDVVVLCEGDPLFYGSFLHLAERLAPRFAVEVVPGVTSVSACAAAAALPLCRRNEPLTVLPAPSETEALADALRRPGALAVMKIGRHLDRVRAAVATAGRLDQAVYVAEATTPSAIIRPLAEAPQAAPYFSMILLPATRS